MVQFLAPLDLRVYKPGLFVVLTDFPVLIEPDTVIAVPRGLITDLASVPKAIQIIPGFNANGGSRRAAVMHDWLYTETGNIKSVNGATLQFDRDQCDKLLREGLIAAGEPIEVADAFYAGVRIGGGEHWGKVPRSEFYVQDSYWND